MKGWCPVDDRVFDAADGTCPECGAALVALSKKKQMSKSLLVIREDPGEIETQRVEPSAEAQSDAAPESPAQVGVAAIAGAAAIVVVGAFLLGVAITRGKSGEPTPAVVPKARASYEPGRTERGAGVALRLDAFSQRGRDVVLRVTVPPQPGIEVGKISRVAVVPLSTNRDLGQVELTTRITTSGFIATGRAVSDASIPITGLQIVNLTMRVEAGADLPIDLGGVWPATAATAPLSRREKVTATSGDGRTFRLTGIVGWADRLESAFEVAGTRPGWGFTDRYFIIIPPSAPDEAQFVDGNGASSTRHVIFRGIARRGGAAMFRVATSAVTIEGHWRWMFV